jgi:HD superfamily phosphodiesterase
MVGRDLADEPVASCDHVERMTTWCQKLGPAESADLETLVAGALVHDIGVLINRKKHYVAGRERALQIFKEAGVPEDKIEAALEIMETHSRYGGSAPQTIEAKVGQDSDALEYIGAIGIIRMVVRGMTDGSFSGRASDFPGYMRSILAKVENTFHTGQAAEIGAGRLAFMERFLEHIEKELKYEA